MERRFGKLARGVDVVCTSTGIKIATEAACMREVSMRLNVNYLSWLRQTILSGDAYTRSSWD